MVPLTFVVYWTEMLSRAGNATGKQEYDQSERVNRYRLRILSYGFRQHILLCRHMLMATEYSINSILYQRGIYPPENFIQVKKYGLSILVCFTLFSGYPRVHESRLPRIPV